jgi:hypothetical protein
MDNYPYVAIDFKGDPDMPLPPGSSYGGIRIKNVFEYFIFCIFVEEKKNIFDDVKY